MLKPRAVAFDIGNVLLNWQPHRMMRSYFATDEAYERFRRETRLDWLNLDFDAGLPFADGTAALVARFPQHEAPIRAFDERWAECVDGFIPANVDTLKALKAAGHPAHAITNFSREKFDVARRIYPFLDLFDHALVSGDVGLIKPDYRIYHRFCRDTGLEPEEIVFVDDSPVNVAAAKAVGFHVFHMPTASAEECAAFRAELRRLGFGV